MNFPIDELKLIYKFFTKQAAWDESVLDAMMVVIKYCYEMISHKPSSYFGETAVEMPVEDALKGIIDEHESDAKGVQPVGGGLWIIVVAEVLMVLLKKFKG